MDWFLYDMNLRHERVEKTTENVNIITLVSSIDRKTLKMKLPSKRFYQKEGNMYALLQGLEVILIVV